MLDDVALGRRVVESKLATSEQVRECFATLQAMKTQGASDIPGLGRLLVSKGYVTERELSLLAPSAAPKAEADLELLEDPAAATGKGNRGPSILPGLDELMIAPEPPIAPAVTPTPAPRKAPAVPAPKAVKAPAKRPPAVTPPVGLASPQIKCTFCALEIREGIARQTCEHCGDVYHDDCWTRSSGCIRESCRGRSSPLGAEPRVLAASEYSLYTELRPMLIKIGAAAVLVAVGILAWLHFAHDASYYYELGKALGQKNAAGGGERTWGPADLHRATLAIEETAGAVSTIERTVTLEEQIRDYRIATEKKANFPEAWFALGAAYFELKKYREALDALQKVLALRPNDQQTLLFLGTSSEQMGDFPEAERWYRQAIEAKPEATDAREMLAFMLEKKCEGREADAAKEFDLVLTAHPENVAAAGELAHIWISQKRYDQALALLEKVSQRTPDSPQINLKRAELYLAQGQWEKALQFAEPLAAVESQGTDARRIQALALGKLGRDSEAFVVGKAVCAAGFDDEIYRLTGALAIRAGEPDLGIGYLRTAMQNSRRPETLELVGNTMLALGRAEEARTAFEELRSLNSSWPRAGFMVGLAAVALPDRAKAAAAIRELIARAPADPDLHALEFRLQREGGDPAGALSGLQALVAANPKSYYAHFQLGVSLREANPAAALNEFRTAASILPDPEVRYEMGSIYLALKKDAAAREMMKQYTEVVAYGAHHDKAAEVLGSGGAEEAPDQFTPYLKLCQDLIPKLNSQSFPNPYPWAHVVLALRGVASLVAVLGGDANKAAAYGNQLSESFSNLQSTDTMKRADVLDGVLMREVDNWALVWPDSIEMLVAVVRRRDADKKHADAVDRVLEELRQKVESALTTEERIAGSARAFTSLLNLLVAVLSDTDTTREQLTRIETQRRVQNQVCVNSLERFCGELYAAVKSADLLLGIQDRRKLYDDRKRALQRRFEQREFAARTVAEQLRNGASTLAELIEIIVSDATLRP